MAKFRGVVGFAETVEKTPGTHVEEIIPRKYSGDLLRNTRRLESSGNINDNINISNEISILADAYACDHFYAIRYVEFGGAKWKVASVDATKRPRLVMTLGGLYNE
jgi:hypothetical protein